MPEHSRHAVCNRQEQSRLHGSSLHRKGRKNRGTLNVCQFSEDNINVNNRIEYENNHGSLGRCGNGRDRLPEHGQHRQTQQPSTTGARSGSSTSVATAVAQHHQQPAASGGESVHTAVTGFCRWRDFDRSVGVAAIQLTKDRWKKGINAMERTRLFDCWLRLTLGGLLMTALTGCFGVVGTDYYGPDYYGPGYDYGQDVYIFGGYGRDHHDHDFGRRGAESRGFIRHGGGGRH